MLEQFLDVLRHRRSIYNLGDEEIVPRARIEQIVGEVLRHTPSSFHMQSARILLLFGDSHKKLWKITEEALQRVTNPAQFAETKAKIANCFACGYGTVLFFEDQAVVDKFSAQFPLYAENFRSWMYQSNAMCQINVWNALVAAGLGASLQHYNPLIDDAVRAQWKLPQEWKLVAEMPFGTPLEPAGEKETMDVAQRLKVFA